MDSIQGESRGWMKIRTYTEKLVGILYPRRCPLCGEILRGSQELICRECRPFAVPIQEPKCRCCGRKLEDECREYCTDCQSVTHHFAGNLAVFEHRGKIKEAIYRFKFHNIREYASFFGEAMAEYGEKFVADFDPQVLIPVPVHWKKRRARGYNQAELLARELGRRLDIPVDRVLVRRVKNTRPQKALSKKERRENIKSAFELKTGVDVPERVLLVDDIYTTGSTLEEIAVLLKGAGVKEIWCFTLSIGTSQSF